MRFDIEIKSVYAGESFEINFTLWISEARINANSSSLIVSSIECMTNHDLL